MKRILSDSFNNPSSLLGLSRPPLSERFRRHSLTFSRHNGAYIARGVNSGLFSPRPAEGRRNPGRSPRCPEPDNESNRLSDRPGRPDLPAPPVCHIPRIGLASEKGILGERLTFQARSPAPQNTLPRIFPHAFLLVPPVLRFSVPVWARYYPL